MIGSEDEAKAYVRSLTNDDGFAKLEHLAALVLEENRHQNLIAKATEAALWQRHIADSAQLVAHVPAALFSDSSKGPWLDLGTGPGFPGLVIAAIYPKMPVLLVEARARRAAFLARCIEALGLAKCRVEAIKLERVRPFAARAISARAFAPLPKLLELVAPFSTKETVYVLPKGRSAAQEVSELKQDLRPMFHVKQSLTDPEAGIIVWISRQPATNERAKKG